MKPVSDSEKFVLYWIWEQKSATSKDIIEHFAKTNDWKQTTASTFLKRLVLKGYLNAERNGRTFIYSPKITKEEFDQNETIEFVNNKFGGSLKEFIAAYTTATNNKKEIKELRDWFTKQF